MPSWPGDVDRDPADDLGVVAQVLGQPQDDVVELLPLDHLREGPAADRHLDDGLDVGHVDAVAGALVAVDLDLQVGLADDVEQADVLDPPDRLEDVDDPLPGLLQHVAGRCRRA